MPEQDSILACCVQLCASDNLQANLDHAAELIAEAAKAECELLLLPENFSFMGANEQAKFDIAEAQESSSVLAFLSDQAKQHRMAIIGGSVLLRYTGNNRVRNCCPVFSSTGEMLAYYDKIHLFDAELPNERYRESDTVESGSQPKEFALDAWKVGLSICYDLRFPELYRHYSSAGCNILTVPAPFTVPTGKAHWETLLRARAIENQCYVLAAGQYGTHPGGRKTWGHSMIIDPWGKVLAELEDGEGIITAELSLGRVKEIRECLPALNHRRL
jgi:nitrilase